MVSIMEGLFGEHGGQTYSTKESFKRDWLTISALRSNSESLLKNNISSQIEVFKFLNEVSGLVKRIVAMVVYLLLFRIILVRTRPGNPPPTYRMMYTTP